MNLKTSLGYCLLNKRQLLLIFIGKIDFVKELYSHSFFSKCNPYVCGTDYQWQVQMAGKFQVEVNPSNGRKEVVVLGGCHNSAGVLNKF